MRRLSLLSALMGLLLCPLAAHAWPRGLAEDGQLVERSTLIVIAHLKPGSLVYIDHNRPANRGASWEYHATLVITQTLKGKPAADEIPLTLLYGITPMMGGKLSNPHEEVNLPGYPPNSIQIANTANDVAVFCDDATKDNLWLLQKRSGVFGDQTGVGDLGIADPEELQPLALVDYFKCYLAADPEAAVRAYLPQHQDVAVRAGSFLEHKEVQRIVLIKDPAERAEKLLPYFARGAMWRVKREAYEAMVAAGPKAAGPVLLKLYNDPAAAKSRRQIFEAWGEMRYVGGLEYLIDVLVENERWWAAQKLEPGWWNKEVESAQTQERRRRYGEVYSAVSALAQIRHPQSRSSLVATLHQWQSANFESSQMVDALKTALQGLPGISTQRQ